MREFLRPLPVTIIVIALLIGSKSADLAKHFSIGSPARANTVAAASPPPAPPRGTSDQKPASPPPGSDAGRAMPATKPVIEMTPGPAADCGEPMTESERTTLQDLRNRRKQLDERASGLDEREALIGATEQRLTERLAELRALQAKLETLEKDRKDREEANWKGLVATYEAMKPRDAASIFNDLDNTVLIQVLDRMKEAKAALVLAAMTPERARAATIQLAKYREQVTAAPRLSQNGQNPK